MLKAFVVIYYFWQGPATGGEHKVELGPVFTTKADCEAFRLSTLQFALNPQGRKQAEKDRIDLASFQVKCVEFGK